MKPPRFSYNNFLRKTDTEVKFFANCQQINSKSVDFYEIEHCSFMMEGEGSTLLTFELKKISVITQHIKELVSKKFSALLRITC